MNTVTQPKPRVKRISEKKATLADVWASFMDTDRRMKETDRQIQETKELIRQYAVEFEKSKKYWDAKIGAVHNSLGFLVEAMLTPQLYSKFHSLGYTFTCCSRDKEIRGSNNRTLTEIDAFLENGDYAMLIEAKIKPTVDDVAHHTRRMEIMRAYADAHGDKRKFIGAVAAPHFPDSVKAATLDAGFFVIVPSEDAVDIVVPPEFKPTEW